MNIREQIKKDFGVDLPIKGGIGNSIDNPIILEKQNQVYDFVATEYAYLKFLGIGRGIIWQPIKQKMILHNDRRIDKITIKTVETTDEEIVTQIENYYFDITECWGQGWDFSYLSR